MNRLNGLVQALAGALCRVTGAPAAACGCPTPTTSNVAASISSWSLNWPSPTLKLRRALWGKVIPLIPLCPPLRPGGRDSTEDSFHPFEQ